MKKEKIQIEIIILVIIFICGLTIVINSFSLGNFFAGQYDSTGWSLSAYEANIKIISFMIVGALISFLSGLGKVFGKVGI